MDCPVTARPTVIVISDSLGDTACEVVLAASGQFDEGAFRLLRLPKVTSVEQVESFVGPRVDADHRDIAVFHTIVDPALRARVLDYLGMLHIRSVDLIGPTLAVLSSLIGVPPKGVAGVIHKTDDRYFHRIEAMEYFVEHDDGRGCDDLSGGRYRAAGRVAHIQDAAVDVFSLSGLQGCQCSFGPWHGAAEVNLRGRPDAVVRTDFDCRCDLRDSR